MKRTRITEITVETEEVFLIRRPERFIHAWCPQCAASVHMVAPEQAAAMLSVKWREIARRIEADSVHFLEMPAGSVLVCVDSLARD